jgi:hypothetical protein
MFTFHQISDKRGYAVALSKTALLHEMGRLATLAYDLGASFEEVKAICGAAYGDWDEAQHLNASQELLLPKVSVREYQS